MKNDILDKLGNFLTKHDPFSEECHVVYFIVQIRKLLEYVDGNNSNFPLLKFYCDWILHTNKSYRNSNWTYVIDMLDEGIRDKGNGKYEVSIPKGLAFMYGTPLKFELKRIFVKLSFSSEYIDNKDWWRSFQLLLFNALKDQPICNPTNAIKEIKYTKIEENMITCSIDFSDSRGKISFEIPI